MNDKSFIQEQLEYIQSKSILEKDIRSILEKYDVKDTVFGLYKNRTIELSEGYMIESKRFDNLTEAIRSLDRGQVLRVLDNDTFIIGDVYEHLYDCPEDADNIFNIEFLEDVY